MILVDQGMMTANYQNFKQVNLWWALLCDIKRPKEIPGKERVAVDIFCWEGKMIGITNAKIQVPTKNEIQQQK